MDSESDISFTAMDCDVEEPFSSPRGGYVQWQSSQIQGLPRHVGQPTYRTEKPRVSALLPSPSPYPKSPTSSSGSSHSTFNTFVGTGKPRRRPQTSNKPNNSAAVQIVGAFKLFSDKLEASVARVEQGQDDRARKRSAQSGSSSTPKHEVQATTNRSVDRKGSASTAGTRKGKEGAKDVEPREQRATRATVTSDRTWPSIGDSTEDSSMDVDDYHIPTRAATVPSIPSKDLMEMPPPPVPPSKVSTSVFASNRVPSNAFLPIPQELFPKVEPKPPTLSPVLHPFLQSDVSRSQGPVESPVAVRPPQKPPLQPQKLRKTSPPPQLGSQRPVNGLPVLGMRRAHTIPQTSTSSALLPTKQKSFKPPLLSQAPPSQRIQQTGQSRSVSTSIVRKRSLSPELLPPPPVAAATKVLISAIRPSQSQPTKSQTRVTKPLPIRKVSEPPPCSKAPTPSPPSPSNGSGSSSTSSRLTRHSSNRSSTTTVTSLEEDEDYSMDKPGSPEPELIPQPSSPASSYGDVSFDGGLWEETLQQYD
ncbi:hypothetical protein BDN72DRAFT_959693 [Pluteus cervinus]|uniref:Uncharacterized protein n=1 Tax=Pluteus cervinus TaxID=181527 RepID=A0ACD3AU70_9AGAR|nr:hypothetical protein BDN72DRAFT_959693 [Pluteus cervinus]